VAAGTQVTVAFEDDEDQTDLFNDMQVKAVRWPHGWAMWEAQA
jgi:hypothetical protein